MLHRGWRAAVLGAAMACPPWACSSDSAPGAGQRVAGAAGSGASAAGASAAGASAAGASAAAASSSAGTSGGVAPAGGAGASMTGGKPSGGGGAGGHVAGVGTAGSASGSDQGGQGASTDEPPTAGQLLGKLGSCNKISGPYNPDDPGSGNINVCQTGTAVWWKADMDVDCDGIQTPPCDTDRTGQPQTSIVDLAPNDDVDPTKLPYFVIPLGDPETEWYTAYGIELGQVGAVIYKNQVVYGIFADQAGGNFIGEASYQMCSLFIGAGNCDPNNGGIDPLDVTYITFTGTKARASGQDIYNHDRHTELGEAAAQIWLSQ